MRGRRLHQARHAIDEGKGVARLGAGEACRRSKRTPAAAGTDEEGFVKDTTPKARLRIVR